MSFEGEFQLKKVLTLGITVLAGLTLTACGNSNNNSNKKRSSTASSLANKRLGSSRLESKKKADSESSSNTKAAANNSAQVLTKLVSYTDKESAGPTQNYYWNNGKSKLTNFNSMKAGKYTFSDDNQGRSSVAKAMLTYSEYQASKGSRQGTPLDPPAWPSNNPKVAIHYGLTDRIYHGFLYNRSHSIADSLLGSGSYTSEYNFTTGTWPQNVGANQEGGMRYAEELVENYWKTHTNSKNTVSYETTPLYKGNERIPRGSVVDIKSSDNQLNKEVVVINSVEGIKINYDNGSNNAKAYQDSSRSQSSKTYVVAAPKKHSEASTTNSSSSVSTKQDSTYTTNGSWKVAATGMVFGSNSNKYYSQVTNPSNYQYMSQSSAQASCAQPANRGNQYARP